MPSVVASEVIVDCFICTEPLCSGDTPENGILLPCKHILGAQCLIIWLNKSSQRPRCPLCRRDILSGSGPSSQDATAASSQSRWKSDVLVNWYSRSLISRATRISGLTTNETVAVRWEFRIEDLVTEDPTVASLALVFSRTCKFEPDFVAKLTAAGGLSSPMIKSLAIRIEAAKKHAKSRNQSTAPYKLLSEELKKRQRALQPVGLNPRVMLLRKIRDAIDAAIMQTSVLELTFLQRLNCIRHMVEEAENRPSETVSDAHLQAARAAVAELLDIFKWTRDDPDFEVPDLLIELAYRNAIGYGGGKKWETRMFAYVPVTPSTDTTLAMLTAELTLGI
ncbi:MAG: hypothetical protein LQ346_004726 [Caloplaca aetnensis]|nr:MAG: hypothetical protein LQ346_004726 [Caloplaca aetnensis]